MYDPLRTRYVLSCPELGEATVTLSDFRRLERLPGTAHPALFQITFACRCGGEHPGLVSHDELDWAPLGLEAGPFVDLMTDGVGEAGSELAELAAGRIRCGEWPWSFFCYLEGRSRPVFPSSFSLLAPGTTAGLLGLAVRCPDCASQSINLVSREHVDLPFHNDREIGVVEHVFEADAERALEQFRVELYSSHFDTRRLAL
ncbi:MAG TPA: hypothetical protein VF895_05220 [Gaiellaceae bacterium]